MEQLQVLTEQNILDQNFKIYGTQEEPLFSAKDVARWIEHTQPSRIVNMVDEDEKAMHIVHTLGGPQQTWYLTESGMYEVLMQSRKPIAKKFKKQVKQVLKDIRKHGMYATPQTVESMLSDPDTAIQLLENYKQEKNQRLIAEQRLKELEPKATYYDVVLQNKSLVTIGQIAKDYGMSAQTLNKLLHELKVQYKQSGQWLLYSNLHDKGYTHSSTTEIEHKDGSTSIRMNTKWTQKGRLFIYELLKGQEILPTIEREDVS